MKHPLITLLLLLAFLAPLRAADSLERGFNHPPPSARPWVYWFPLDGNISSNGITADLEAMQRVGIGGVLYMETEQGTPKGPAKFGGALWRDLFKHICAEAHRLGLEVNMNNDAGWCGSGGPWITPETSMQKIVWTETNIAGPLRFDGQLREPQKAANYYGDIAVFAFPTPGVKASIAHLSEKSALTKEEVPLSATFPTIPPEAVVARDRILDLTTNLGSDGHLTWDVPAGQWTLLRVGHTSTGTDNHPAPMEGRGLESDKLSKEATDLHFDSLMAKLIADNRPLTGTKRTLVATHIDSWETGSQNWTPKWREEFQRLRGYDPRPYLPVIAGEVVDSIEVSERFLWDVRMTVNDLLLENYARQMRTLAHRHGMRLSIEAYDGVPADDLTYGGCADEPMAEFWSWDKFGAAYSCTEMSSAAHVYGRRILGAESFTATDAEKWQGHPAKIKDLGDWAFCEGINRFVFHRYALQPWTNPDRPPGISMGPWGLHYERTQTWWEQSRAWHEYLARCQFILQQGLFVADLCFLAPERSPQRFKSPVKSGYDRPVYNFDACPPEVLLTRMEVRHGRLVLPDGMSYRMLVLPKAETMTPRLLRKIRDLVNAGATVLGAPPRKSPSLRDYPSCDQEVQSLTRELWGADPASDGFPGRRLGKGRVIWASELGGPQDPSEPADGSFDQAKWIWFQEGSPAVSAPPGKRYFRCDFNVEATSPIDSAKLVMTADNEFQCWVNGQSAGQGNDFHRGFSMDVRALLKPGTNSLAVAAVNLTDTPNPAGLIAALKIKYRDGHAQEVRTDKSWLAAQSEPTNWIAGADSAEGWSPALELGPLGMEPWGEVETPESRARRDEIPDIAIPSRVLAQMNVRPDFEADTRLRYIHKRIGDTEVYFIANPEPHETNFFCTFRVTSKQPELWWPDTGRTELAGAYELKDDCMRLPLRFEPSGSVFVVFRKKLGNHRPVNGAKNWLEFKPLEAIGGSWEASFDPKWGGPSSPVTFDTLEDWSKRPEPGVRYYSGTAIYRKKFNLDATRSAGERRFLDLGKVQVMAEVTLNGKDLGILWKPPFRVEVTDALKAGENTLELRVVNLWINRLIGDEQLPEDSDRNPNGTLKSWPVWLGTGKPSPTGRYTFTSWRLWKKDEPLVESGLLGPVRLLGVVR